VDAKSLAAGVAVNRINLNDQTVRGHAPQDQAGLLRAIFIRKPRRGPHDSTPLFAEFRALIERRG